MGIESDKRDAQAVDGPEGQLSSRARPEERLEAPLHIPGSGYRVGDSQEVSMGDASAVDKAAQLGHQNSGLAAPRHRQQQHRPLRLIHSLCLLGI